MVAASCRYHCPREFVQAKTDSSCKLGTAPSSFVRTTAVSKDTTTGGSTMKRLWMLVYLFCFFSSTLSAQNTDNQAALDVASKAIRPDTIRAHIRFLSDSLLTGRAPGTPGYDIAAHYVATELEGMGLHPAVSGNLYQPVPFEKAVTDAAASSFTLTIQGKEQKLTDAKDYVLSTWFASPAGKQSKAESNVDPPVVFV